MVHRSTGLRLYVCGVGPLPEPPRATRAFRATPDAKPLAEDGDGETVVSGWFDARGGEIVVAGLATFAFSARDDKVVALSAPDASIGDIVHSFYTTATPLIAWAVDGLEALHASAVRDGAGVIAFCGPTESGKTTLAHAFAARGRERFAEDAVAFRASENGVLAVAMPFTVNLREPTQAHFGPDNLPARDDVHRADAGESPLRAVFLLDPTTAARTARIERVRPADALLALLPNAHRFKQQPLQRERQMLEAYLALVEQVAVYRLTYGQAFEELDRVVDEIVSTAAA